MSLKLFTCQGGHIILPSSVLVSRQDGGNLWIIPPRDIGLLLLFLWPGRSND
jgi:hypothetical protein